MAGGADAKLLRKRKRKTRSERNQLRNSQMEQERHGGKNTQKKKDDAPVSSSFGLQSSKNSVAPLPPVPREVRMSCNITQGRLTMGLFPYSKTSDCVKRESASMKKKVEDDLRLIVNPSASPTAGCSRDDDMGCNYEGEKMVTTGKDTVINESLACKVLINSKARQVLPSSSSPKASDTHKSSVHVQTWSPRSTTSHVSNTNSMMKSCPKSNKSSSSSSSTKSDNELDEMFPVNEIASKILENLKPKFKKLFPARDLNTELNCSLKKLLKQSSRKVHIPNHPPVIPDKCIKERLQQGLDKKLTGTYPTTSYSIFQPFGNEASLSPKFQSVCIGDAGDKSETAVAAQNLLSNNGFVTSDKPSLSSLLSQQPPPPPPPPPLQYFIHSNPNHHNLQGSSSKSVRFILPSNPISSNNYDKDTNTDNHNVFVVQESNRSTIQHHKPFGEYVSHHHHIGNVRTNSSLGFFLPTAFGDNCDSQDQDKPILINIDGKDGQDSDNDDDSGLALAKYNSFMASARSLKAKLERQNEQKHVIQDLPHQCLLQGRRGSCVCQSTSPVTICYSKNSIDRFKFSEDRVTKHSGLEALSPFGRRKTRSQTSLGGSHRQKELYHHNHDNNNYRNHHYYQLRSKGHLSAIPDCIAPKSSESGLSGSSNLAQSRHRLKTALDSIFTSAPVKPIKSSALHHNESMDWRDGDILADILPHVTDSSLNTQQQYDVNSQHLDQLRVHQSDMQHQARNFLELLDKDESEISLDQINHRIPNSSPPPPPSSHKPNHFFPFSSSSCPPQTWL